jgi:hypothetical protein
MGDLFHLFNNDETQWIAAEMATRHKKTSEYFAIN